MKKCYNENFNPFDEYSEDWDYDIYYDISIRNYSEVIRAYNYSQYVKRFRIMAKHQMLQQSQRPKLSEDDFDKLLQSLKSFLNKNEEKSLFNSQKRVKTIFRLLMQKKLTEWN